MALSFEGIQPVEFGGRACTPKIDAEIKLRLSSISDYDDKADDVLASAFPDDEKYVRKFLKDKMSTMDKQMLQAYLIGGPSALDMVQKQIDEAFKKGISANE